MALTIKSTVLQNCSKWYVVQYSIIGDGTTGDVVLSQVNAVAGDCAGPTLRNSIYDIQGASSSVSAQIFFKGATNYFAVQLPANYQYDFNWLKRVPIPNEAVTPTGDILISTNGIVTAGAALNFLLTLRKK